MPLGPSSSDPRRILIVSDAWRPQVNGVVRTLGTVTDELRALGHMVEVVGPNRFRTIPCPTYPAIRLAVLPARRLAGIIEGFAPDALHLATEGPLGIAARRWARSRSVRFTTSFHTRFPEYLASRHILPSGLVYRWLRHFHGAASATMVATESLRADIDARGFDDLALWSRGVDLSLFSPSASGGATPHGSVPAGAPGIAPPPPRVRDPWAGLPRPVFLNVGRVAVEKNLAAFLQLDLPGSKVVVGDGPQLGPLRRRFPDATFTGALAGPALAAAYASADVFVFPSRTDTFGLVMLESLACGTPVAAYPVTGPLDVLTPAVGAMDTDLQAAALRALALDRAACRAHANRFSWRACAELFLRYLVPVGEPSPLPR